MQTWKPDNQLGIMVTNDRTQCDGSWRSVVNGMHFLSECDWLKQSIKRGAKVTNLDVMDYMISHGVKPSQILLIPERASDS